MAHKLSQSSKIPFTHTLSFTAQFLLPKKIRLAWNQDEIETLR